MEQARAFLARVLPWDIHPEAYRNIHYKGSEVKGSSGQYYWPGSATTSLDEAVAQVEYYASKYTNVFVTPGLQTKAKEAPKVINGRTVPATASRGKNQTLGSKAFYLDIDVKQGAYGTTADILQALSSFINQLSLPKPTTLTASGGGGVHCYWVIDQLIAPTEWLIIARALSNAASSVGLVHDANVTNDICHLMRVPGTFNGKYSPTPLCHTLGRINPIDVPLGDFKRALAQFLPSNVVSFPAAALPARAPITGPSEFSEGVTPRSSEPVPMVKLRAACATVREGLETGGAGHSGGGIWPLMILTTAFVEDGRAWAHEISKGHPEYDPAAVDAKFDEKVAARGNGTGGVGWPSCAAISAALPAGPCTTCKFRTRGRTPFHFLEPEKPSNFDLPLGYTQNALGVQFNTVDHEDKPKQTKVCSYQVIDAWLDKSLEGAGQINFSFWLNGKPAGIATIPGDKATSQMIGPLMARQDFYIGPAEQRPFLEFVMSWITLLQGVTGSGENTPPLGWVGNGDTPIGFAYDGVTYTAKGKERAARSDTTMLAPWHPRGELAKWQEAAKFITDQQRPALDAMLAAAFAGPLVKFTGHKGLLSSAYSPETGIGKTTAMQVAAAVWGHPTDSAQALDDTMYSSLKRLGAINSLPFFWDEVRLASNDKTDKLAMLIFALTTGRERTRMNSNSTIQVAGKWQTMMMTASNQSILEIARNATAGTDAGGVRVFEWRVAPAANIRVTSSEATRINAMTVSNFGHAGRTYAEWLGQNTGSLRGLVAKVSDDLNRVLNANPDERFWVSSAACLLVGAAIARKLGLVDFNLGTLRQFCLDTVQALRDDRTSSPSIGADTTQKATDLIAAYLAEARFDKTLVTSVVGGPIPAVQIENSAQTIKVLDVHIDRTAGMVHMRSAPLVVWLDERGLQKKSTFEGLRRVCGAVESRLVLGARTSYSIGVAAPCISIPMSAVGIV
jgi:hypothetical protein